MRLVSQKSALATTTDVSILELGHCRLRFLRAPRRRKKGVSELLLQLMPLRSRYVVIKCPAAFNNIDYYDVVDWYDPCGPIRRNGFTDIVLVPSVSLVQQRAHSANFYFSPLLLRLPFRLFQYSCC